MSIPSIPSTVHKHDGHVEGNLNCIAIRHGWTRTFSISPEEVANLDYHTLERILELSTLKLRSLGALRIYVENPANSRIYTKVRYWKDDGSLQSNLVKDFFEDRMRNGGLLRFEVRDGRERSGGVVDEDVTVAAESVGSEAPASPTFPPSRKALRKKSMSFDWFTRKGGPHPEDKSHNPTRTRGFFDIIVSFVRPATIVGSTDETAPLQPHGDREDANAERHAESAPETSRARASLKQRMMQSSSPFFVSSATRARTRVSKTARFQSHSDSGIGLDASPPRRSVPAGHFPEDVTDDPDQDSVLDATPPPVPDKQPQPGPSVPAKPLARFRPFVPKSGSTGTLPTRKLKRRPGKRDKAAPDDGHFKGADVVRRPEDAWAAVASRSESALGHVQTEQPSTDPSSTRVMSIGNLLDDDEDPFRG